MLWLEVHIGLLDALSWGFPNFGTNVLKRRPYATITTTKIYLRYCQCGSILPKYEIPQNMYENISSCFPSCFRIFPQSSQASTNFVCMGYTLYVAIWRSSSLKRFNQTYPKCHRSVMHVLPHSCGTTRASWC